MAFIKICRLAAGAGSTRSTLSVDKDTTAILRTGPPLQSVEEGALRIEGLYPDCPTTNCVKTGWETLQAIR